MDQGNSDRPLWIWVGALVVVGAIIALGALTVSYFDPPSRPVEASSSQ